MEVTQQQRLATIAGLFVKGMRRNRYTRLIFTDLLMGFEPGTLRSTNDLTDEQITSLLDEYFPEWREELVEPADHAGYFVLAKQANELVDSVYPHPPEPTPEERSIAEQHRRAKYEAYKEQRRAKKHAAYLEREAKRQAKKKAAQEKKHLETQAYQNQMDNERLSRLNEWRAKAGLPPVEEL